MDNELPDSIVDGVGRTITDPRIIREFRLHQDLVKLHDRLLDLGDDFKRAVLSPLGSFMSAMRIDCDIKNLHRAIKFARPYALCPYCGGKADGCMPCRQRGWMPKEMYERTPIDLK